MKPSYNILAFSADPVSTSNAILFVSAVAANEMLLLRLAPAAAKPA
jgi:hypothetical protein